MLLAVHKLVVFRNVWEPIYKYHCVFCYPHIATEYRNWLLHYSVPVLQGALPAHYFLHYTMLVTAIATLVSDQISQQKLQQADKLLENFVNWCQNFMVNLNYFFIILLTQLLRGIAHITNNLHACFNLCLIVFCFLRQGLCTESWLIIIFGFREYQNIRRLI